MGVTGVSNLKARASLLVVGLLATLLVLALSACGGGGGEEQAKAKEQAKARPLPMFEEDLRPGEYHSGDFEPSLYFSVGKDWQTTGPELSDFIELAYQGETGFIRFANIKEVYKPGTLTLMKVPKDLAGWLQEHPYLKTSKPEPVTVGGVKGEQFDVLVENLPQDYSGMCGSECVDIASLSSGQASVLYREPNKRRVIILEDVKGDRVYLDFSSPIDAFDEYMPEAQKVLDTVKWAGS
jgi:hypothetical protein